MHFSVWYITTFTIFRKYKKFALRKRDFTGQWALCIRFSPILKLIAFRCYRDGSSNLFVKNVQNIGNNTVNQLVTCLVDGFLSHLS